jgi:translation elongation factor EF-G
MKEEIKPLYGELVGLASGIPETDNNTVKGRLGRRLNEIIQRLEDKTGDELERFNVEIQQGKSKLKGRYNYVHLDEYRTNVFSLMSRLEAHYLPEEWNKESDGESTILQQTQSQSQSQTQQMVLEVQSMLDKKLANLDEGDEKRDYIEKIKNNLSNITSPLELLNLIIKTAKNMNMTIDQIGSIFA